MSLGITYLLAKEGFAYLKGTHFASQYGLKYGALFKQFFWKDLLGKFNNFLLVSWLLGESYPGTYGYFYRLWIEENEPVASEL
jgi:hypothetical protein